MNSACVVFGAMCVFALFYTGSALRLNLFEYPCPIGCAQRTCTQLGCTACVRGYSVLYRNGMSICVTTCPEGDYKHPLGFCTRCNIPNCQACTDENTCTACDRGYELDRGECTRRFRG
ncbi:R-spondin-1-like [Liolophura sinensis]|uniref:R-spondin-1-like n=1 Tax=Liolophura sinensis TaxID=3198878 RepID=UPI003158B7B6